MPSHDVAGNQLTLLRNGAAYFPALCADIDSAHHSIELETYILAGDSVGRMIVDALCRAAMRGLSVRLLLDGFGSAALPAEMQATLTRSGVELLWFRREISPFTLQPNRHRRLLRMHRKLVVIDGNIAYVGGINLVDDIPADGSSKEPRLDYAVRIDGPLANEVRLAMRRLWRTVAWANLHRRGKAPEAILHAATHNPPIALLLRDSLRHRRAIERAYVRAIFNAREEIIIANAYFLPGRAFRRALIHASKRGVRVVLMLQGKVEYWLQHYATQGLYDRLIEAGIEIYEYQASHLHAKVAVIDRHWATVGSSNIDPFSLLLAREANLQVRDAGFSEELRTSLLSELHHSGRKVKREHRRLWAKLLSRASYGVIRLLVWLFIFRRKRRIPD